jgi:hypothetical protein
VAGELDGSPHSVGSVGEEIHRVSDENGQHLVRGLGLGLGVDGVRGISNQDGQCLLGVQAGLGSMA